MNETIPYPTNYYTTTTRYYSPVRRYYTEIPVYSTSWIYRSPIRTSYVSTRKVSPSPIKTNYYTSSHYASYHPRVLRENVTYSRSPIKTVEYKYSWLPEETVSFYDNGKSQRKSIKIYTDDDNISVYKNGREGRFYA